MADFDNLFDAAIARADETIRGYMGTSATMTSGEQSGSCDKAAQGNLFPRFHSAMYFFSLILRSSVLDSLSSIPSAFRQNSSAFSVSPVM